MKIEFDLEMVSDGSFGPRAEVSIICDDKRRVIYAEYPNGNYKGGPEAAAFGLVARRFEDALKELYLERS